VLLFSPPRLGERISRLLADECEKQDLAAALEKAEGLFFQKLTGDEFLDENDLTAALEEQKFTVNCRIFDQKEERLITEKDLAFWFNAEQSRWGSFMSQNLEKSVFSAIEEAFRIRAAKGPFSWKWKSICLKASSAV
ncbi:MAG: recombinase RarA, partial [Treponema sp.]|nr:recombinase RarA [Treponema sp.]